MAKDYNYFEYDGNIVTRESVIDRIKPVFSSFLSKVNEQKEAQEKEQREAETAHNTAAAFPEDILELIGTDPEKIAAEIDEEREAEKRREEADRKWVITVSGESEAPEYDENVDYSKASYKSISHKSGERIQNVAHSIKEGTIAVAAVIEEKESTSTKARRAVIIGFMFIFAVVVLVLAISIFMHQITKGNDEIYEFNEAAGKVCADYIKEYGVSGYEDLKSTYDITGYRLTGICFVREIDFDNDGISELMIAYNNNGEYYNEVWGFNKKKEFVSMFSEKAAQSTGKSPDAYSTLYRRGNKYYIGVHDAKDLSKITLYQMKNYSFSKKYDCVFNDMAKSYEVEGHDDTPGFERIKYAVYQEDKATTEAEKVAAQIDSFYGDDAVKAQISTAQSLNGAYYKVVQDYNKRYGTAKYVEANGSAYISGLAVVELVDFNGDGTDELLLVYRKPIIKHREESYKTYSVYTYYCEIYRYTGTKAVIAYTCEGLSKLPDKGDQDYYIVVKKEGKKSYYCTNTFSEDDYGSREVGTSSMYKFSGTRLKPFYTASYETEYGYTDYYIDGEEVGNSTFEERGYKVALFDGDTENYDKEKFNVIFVKRAKKNSADLSDRCEKTEKTIQKLNKSYSAKQE